ADEQPRARPKEPAPPALPEGCDPAPPRPEVPEPLASPPLDRPPPGDLVAVVATTCGDIVVDLAEGSAPRNVANFVGLARAGFYDGLRFHRVEKNSVLQAGDPNGRALDPPDGPGYTLGVEPSAVPDEPRRYVYGVVAMANVAEGTAGSQFFIVVHDYEGALEGDPEPAGYRPDYPIIGAVARRSWETLQRIARVETRGGSADPARAVEPVLPIAIRSIEVRS
ncbi:MAG TPA: peptidylprolyl isomerase, partial [Actinomycetota bacterium]|nr:peptidylprolyl isomerase [Actinomycetota bacterium]